MAASAATRALATGRADGNAVRAVYQHLLQHLEQRVAVGSLEQEVHRHSCCCGRRLPLVLLLCGVWCAAAYEVPCATHRLTASPLAQPAARQQQAAGVCRARCSGLKTGALSVSANDQAGAAACRQTFEAVDTRDINVRVAWRNMLHLLEAWSVLHMPRRKDAASCMCAAHGVSCCLPARGAVQQCAKVQSCA